MEVSARRAVSFDLPRMVELVTAAIDELRPSRGGALFARREARADVTAEGLTPWLGGDHAVAFLGTIDEAPIGVATAHLEHLRDGGRLAVVDELYVEDGARGIGVGESLMDAVVAWADERGCLGIDAMVLPGNRESKNFFETFGLTARAIVVHRVLGSRT
ncbi:MAG: GNAT family N-acetyltransferase [Acidimicrobiales bacterium]